MLGLRGVQCKSGFGDPLSTEESDRELIFEPAAPAIWRCLPRKIFRLGMSPAHGAFYGRPVLRVFRPAVPSKPKER